MSRAFVKDDGPDEPPIIPPRAPLPAGVPNYVTPRGLALLRDEQAALETERTQLNAGTVEETERKRRRIILDGRMADLVERLAKAKLVRPMGTAPDTVRFGTTVVVEIEHGETRCLQIVGVDEADVSEGRVAFIAPIARALVGKHTGDTTVLRSPQGEEMLTVTSITYDPVG